jgi:anti-anti-sigma factor
MATQLSIDCLQASLAGARLLVCPPKLVRGNEDALMNMVLPLVETSSVILDMSAVESIDAAGVGLLMTLRQAADRSATSLVLANPSRRAREILTLLGLDGVLFCKDA